MNYNYLLLGLSLPLPIISLYYLTKYLLYKLNLALLFRGTKKNIKFNKDEIEQFFIKYNKQDILVDKFTLRSEGEYLDCLYLQNKDIQNSKYITIYFHGNKGNIYDMYYLNNIKNILTYSNVFLFDYRGYGNSTGYSNENTILLDSCNVYYFIMQVIGYNHENIIFYGDSLGSFISSNCINYLHNNKLPIPRGLIMQSPFYSLYEIAKVLYPYIYYLIQYNPDNSKLLKNIKNLLPIIILHSIQDEYIDINHAKKLYYENCDNSNIHFNTVLGIHVMIYYNDIINNHIKTVLEID